MNSPSPFENLAPEELLAWFKAAWQEQAEPDFTQVANSWAGEDRDRVIADLIKVDLEHRWQKFADTGETGGSIPEDIPTAALTQTPPSIGLPAFPQVEDYFASLETPPTEVPDDLLLFEFQIRQRYGDSPTAGEFAESHRIDEEETLRTLTELDTQHVKTRMSTSAPQIPGFERLSPIGKGGMGVVYRAWQVRLGRWVALKVMPPHLAELQDAQLRFEREVFAAGMLKHANVATAYDAGEADGQQYLAIELVNGRDLHRICREDGPLPVETALRFVQQAAAGLGHVHSRGIVHRDIKPSNLMLDENDGNVRVLDFGLARFGNKDLDADGIQESMTQSGATMGTVDYMAPEQAEDVKSADERADVYSLGCTMFTLLTGQSMFPGGSMVNRITAHATKPRPSMRLVRSEIPESVEAIYTKATARDPQDRFQTMAEFEAALSAEVAALSPGDDALTKPSRSGAPVGLLAGVLVLVASVAFGIHYFHDDDDNAGPTPDGETRTGRETGEEHQPQIVSNDSDGRPKEPSPSEGTTAETVPPAEGDHLPGLVPRPTAFPGIGRWQLAFREPATHSRFAEFNLDGTRVACAEVDGLVRVRDAKTAEILQILPGHRAMCRGIGWSRDGSLLASSSMDQTVRVWSQPDGRLLHSFVVAPEGAISGPSFSPVAGEIATTTWDTGLRIWTPEGELIAETGRLETQFFTPAWSPDGKWIAASFDASGMQLYPRTDDGLGDPISVGPPGFGIRRAKWNATGDVLALAGEKTLYVLKRNGDQWQTLGPVDGHFAEITMLAWEGDHLWTGAYDGYVRKWSTSGEITRVEYEVQKGCYARSRSSSGQFANGDGRYGFSLKRFGEDVITTGSLTRRLRNLAMSPSGSRYAVAFSDPGDDYVAADSRIHVLSKSGQPLASFEGRDSVAFLEEDVLLAPATDNIVVRFQLPDSEFEAAPETWGEFAKPSRSIAVSKTGQVAVGLANGELQILDRDGILDRELSPRSYGDFGLGWSSTGWLAASYGLGAGQLWAADGTACWPKAPSSPPSSRWTASQVQVIEVFAWHPTENVLAGGISGPYVSFWAGGRPLGQENRLRTYPMHAHDLVWSPDGTKLAVIGNRGNLRLFARTGGSVSETAWTSGYLQDIAWSPDGELITLADENGTLRRFRVEQTADKVVEEAKPFRLVPESSTLFLPGRQTITLEPDGKIPELPDEESSHLVYLMEKEDGRYEMLTQQQFRKRLARTAKPGI